jgi:ketosteroid isomerase-like protein
LRAIVHFVTIVSLFSGVTSPANATDADALKAAVIDLYAKLNEADADGFIEYMPPEGYTEFDADGGDLFTIEQDYVRDLFASGIKADLAVRDLKVRVFKDAATVTGFRVGGLAMPGEEPRERTLCLSMMWARQGGKWKLVHVHLSPHNP